MSNIYIIDDDIVVRMIISKYLCVMNYNVYEFEDGRKAMQFMSEVVPDLVITDILMPTMDGIEVVRQLKSSAPDCKIIAISQAGPDSSLDLLKPTSAFGADATFVKPVDLDELLETVKTLLSR